VKRGARITGKNCRHLRARNYGKSQSPGTSTRKSKLLPGDYKRSEKSVSRRVPSSAELTQKIRNSFKGENRLCRANALRRNEQKEGGVAVSTVQT